VKGRQDISTTMHLFHCSYPKLSFELLLPFVVLEVHVAVCCLGHVKNNKIDWMMWILCKKLVDKCSLFLYVQCCTTAMYLCVCILVYCTVWLEKPRFFGKVFRFLKVFVDFSAQIWPRIKCQPAVRLFSVNYNKAQNYQLKYEIKYNLYKI